MKFSFFQRSGNWSNTIRLLFLLQFLEKVTAAYDIVFNYNGSNYTLYSTTPEDQEQKLWAFRYYFYDDFSRARCGAVTWIHNATLNAPTILWNDTVVCSNNPKTATVLEFGRAVNSMIQQLFENCTIEAIKKCVAETETYECPPQEKRNNPALIIMACILGTAVFAILSWIVMRAIRNNKICSSRSEQEYYPLSERTGDALTSPTSNTALVTETGSGMKYT